MPKPKTMALFQIVRFALNNIEAEIRWNRDPLFPGEEERLSEDNASDLVIFKPRFYMAIFLNQPPHLQIGGGTVFFSKGLPG